MTFFSSRFSRSLRENSFFVHEVHEADAAPPYLVLVSGTDAAAGSADLFLSALRLAGDIDPFMIRHDDMERLGEQQAAVVLQAPWPSDW